MYSPTNKRADFKGHIGRTEGSTLVIAVIFSAFMLALIAGFFNLAMTEMRISSRAFLFNASFNLAEGGIELGMDAVNRNDNTGWTTGTDGGGTPYWARTFTGYDFGAVFSGEIKVVILDPNSTTPSIYSEGIATGSGGGVVSKQIFVSLSSGLKPFGNGFNSQSGVFLSGQNIVLDSYNSNLGAYGFGNVGAEVTVASTSVASDAVDIGNATVYGYVATGGAPPDVGPSGSITTQSNPGVVDSSRITTDYYQDFPVVSAPSMALPLAVLPNNGVLPPGDYHVASWSSSGTDYLQITGNTRIIVDGDMSMTDNAVIEVAPLASVEIYVGGDLKLKGNGVLNSAGKPEDLVIVGTNTVPGDQDIRVRGNGDLIAAIYAPNGEIRMNGNGRIYGAAAGYEVRIDGDTEFSFDVALRDYVFGSGDYNVEQWVEYTISALDMSTYGL